MEEDPVTWNLYLDDLREPSPMYVKPWWTIARSTEAAKALVTERGMPALMSLDHDLGGEDRAIDFLKWLTNEYWDGVQPIPMFLVHSANPVGAKNLASFMDSWRRSVSL